MDVLERFLLDGREVEEVGILFIIPVLVLYWVKRILEEVGEGTVAFGLISHLTNIILF